MTIRTHSQASFVPRGLQVVLASVVLTIASLVPSATAAGGENYALSADWSTDEKVGAVTTFTTVRLSVLRDGSIGPVRACVDVLVSRQARPRGDITSVSIETGCVVQPDFEVASDLSSARLSPVEIPLNRIIRECPPDDPFDCVFTEEFSRTVLVHASWSATGPLETFCHGTTVADFREVGAPSGTVGDLTFAPTVPFVDTGGYILRVTRTRC